MVNTILNNQSGTNQMFYFKKDLFKLKILMFFMRLESLNLAKIVIKLFFFNLNTDSEIVFLMFVCSSFTSFQCHLQKVL